ncbi:hypothetical protein [Crossiella sp. NPDC003009]
MGVTAVALAGVLGVLAAAPAQALPRLGVSQCLGTQTITFDPPLTLTPRPTTIRFVEDFGTCLLDGVGSARGSGESTETTSAVAVTIPTAEATYHWNTGRGSTVHWARNVVAKVNGSIVVTAFGTVTDGLFRGALAQSVVVLPELDLTAALGEGVSRVSGLDTLTLLQ